MRNLRPYWARDYAGRPFVHFGPSHLAVLGVVLAVNVAWPWLAPALGAEARQALRVGMAAALLINETIWHLWNLTTGQWTTRTLLPFHLCSALVYVSAVMLLTRSYFLYQFCYFLGVGGALQALLTPDTGRYGFPHVKFWTAMISHGLLFTAPLYMTLVEGFRPTWGSILTVAAGTLVYAALVAAINWRLGSNYMYLARPPDTPSLIDRLGPWPWYLPWLAVIAVVTMLILYAPFLFI